MDKQLRPYQQQAIDNVFESYKNNIQSGIINLFTGGGKTFLTTKLVERFRKEVGGQVLFIVDRRKLAYQAKKAFQETLPSLRIGIEMADKKVDDRDDIVIASAQSIGRKGSKRITKFNSDNFKLIISDECHKSVSPMYDRIFNYFGVSKDNWTDNSKLLIGLTATTNRTDGASLGNVYEDIYARYDIKYGIDNGWVTDFVWTPVKTNTDISKVHTRQGEFIQKELIDEIDNPFRNAMILKAYKEIFGGEKCIVFAGSVEHAHKLTNVFNDEGIKSECVEGKTPKHIRETTYEDFEHGDLQVIFNYDVLSVGVDFPELSGMILARPIKSTLLYTQIVGRGVRTSKSAFVDLFTTPQDRKEAIANSWKPHCKLVDLHDNVGKHDVCTLPKLFGLNPKLETEKQEPFYQEVVQPLEALQHEEKIKIDDIVDPDNIDLVLERKKVKLKSYNIDEFIKEASDFTWYPIGDQEYEIVLSEQKKAIWVKKNQVDKYDVFQYNLETHETKRLNTFNSLTGAIKLSDDYIRANEWESELINNKSEWLDDGVSWKQYKLLRRFFKGGAKHIGNDVYKDTGVPKLAINGEQVTGKGHASKIIGEFFNRNK